MRETNANLLAVINRSTEVKVTDVGADEFGAPAKEEVIDHELDDFEQVVFTPTSLG